MSPIFFQCTFRICTYIPWNYGNWTVQCRPLLWLQCKRERDRFVLTLTIASFCNEGNSEQIRLEEHRIRINLILHLFEKAKLQTQLNLDLNVVRVVLIFIVVYTTYKIPPRIVCNRIDLKASQKIEFSTESHFPCFSSFSVYHFLNCYLDERASGWNVELFLHSRCQIRFSPEFGEILSSFLSHGFRIHTKRWFDSEQSKILQTTYLMHWYYIYSKYC